MTFAKVNSIKLLELGAAAGVVTGPTWLLLGALERHYARHPDRGRG